jgi:hypothetical protein
MESWLAAMESRFSWMEVRLGSLEQRFSVQEERMSSLLSLVVRIAERLDGKAVS